MQIENGDFVESASAYGLDSIRDSRGVVRLDFDGDGDLDLLVNNYNHSAQLFRNDVADGAWFEVDLVGTTSNRDAIGAIVELTTGDKTQLRILTGGDSYASQSTKTLHFGLSSSESIDELQIHWPSGLVETYEDLPVRERRCFVEGEAPSTTNRPVPATFLERDRGR